MAHVFSDYVNPISLEETTVFDTLVFPYSFTVAAYYYIVQGNVLILL